MKEEYNSIKFDAKVITDHFYGSVEIHNGRRYDDNLTFVKNKLDSQYQRGVEYGQTIEQAENGLDEAVYKQNLEAEYQRGIRECVDAIDEEINKMEKIYRDQPVTKEEETAYFRFIRSKLQSKLEQK